MPESDKWNPSQYERFRAERSQPFFDLLSLVERAPGLSVVDLGCGTGEWTRHLHEALGAKTTIGLDSSRAMLEKAGALLPLPGLSFAHDDIGRWADARGGTQPFDLVFSNAALHWIPSHEELLARLAAAVAPLGQLAVQVPANFDYPTNRIAAEIATSVGEAAAETHILPPERYAAILHEVGFAKQHVRLVVYPHVLPSREDVIEWVKGTLLTGYEARMSALDFARFMDRYRERLFEELPDTRPFFFPFKRILMWGRKG